MRECVDEGILQSYFDGELSSRMAESVSAHLATCNVCAQAASELEDENLLLASALELEFSVSVPTERLRNRVDAAIADLQARPSTTFMASNASAASAVPTVRRWMQSLADLFRFEPQRAFGYAAVAAVILFAAVAGGIYWNRTHTPADDPKLVTIPTPSPTKDIVAANPEGSPSPSPVQVVPPQPPNRNQVAVGQKPRRMPPRAVDPETKDPEAKVKLLPGERTYLRTIANLGATINAESTSQMKPSLQAEYQRNLAMVDQAIAATRSMAKTNPNDPDAAEFMFAAYQSKIDLLNQVADSRLSNRQH
jgi:hypothetical protein